MSAYVGVAKLLNVNSIVKPLLCFLVFYVGVAKLLNVKSIVKPLLCFLEKLLLLLLNKVLFTTYKM